MFKQLFGGFKRRHDASEYARGFDYAAGELLRGLPAATLSDYVQMSRDFDVFTSFDKGVLAAIQRHKELLGGPSCSS